LGHIGYGSVVFSVVIGDRMEECDLSSMMSFRLTLHALVCSAGLALATFPTGSYANEMGNADGFVSRYHPNSPVKDGWYGIFDPTLPAYASMWDPIIVSQDRVVYDGAYIDDYGCKTDSDPQPSESYCLMVIKQNSYRQINRVQIERQAPDGDKSVLTWFKQLD
jgi:hypothetical protein